MAGYDDFSKSNNAIEAENNGRFPASVIAKKIGVKTAAIKALMIPSEWHHTSSYYNKTSYYSLEEAVEKLDELKKWVNLDKSYKLTNCIVEWLEWSGSRKHPKCEQHKAIGCLVEYNGKSTYKIILPDGKKITKRTGTNGFKVIHESNLK